MDDLVFLKLGGSVITDKTRPEALDEEVLRRVALVVAAAIREQPSLRILIGHGGGSFGHHWAKLYGTRVGARDARGWEGVVLVQDAMSRLCRAVVRHLLDAGVRAMSIQPSASAITDDRALVSMAVDPLVALLGAGVVPVVHGDVVVDRAQGVAVISTEAIFAYLSPILRPRRIILAGEAAVFTADPRNDPRAQPIPIIDETNIVEVLRGTGGSHGMDVTGGMVAKVVDMWKLVSTVANLDVYIIAPVPEALGPALRGARPSTGTLIQHRLPLA